MVADPGASAPDRSNARAADHWEAVYDRKAPDTVSWYQADAAPSLQLIAAAGLRPGEPIVDVGAGASVLVDRLLDLGHRNLSVVDIAARPISLARERLGSRGAGVTWRVQDVRDWRPRRGQFALWHDRAVFHFLMSAAERGDYLRALRRGLRAGGHLLIGVFGPRGPEQCSGLPVQRYAPSDLEVILGSGFRLRRAVAEKHLTPGGGAQDFTWCLFVRGGGQPRAPV